MTGQYPPDADTVEAEWHATDEVASLLADRFDRWATAIRCHRSTLDPELARLLKAVPVAEDTDLVLLSRLIGSLEGGDTRPPSKTAEYRFRVWCNSCDPGEGPLVHTASGRVSPCGTETRSVAVCAGCGREFVLVVRLSQTGTGSAQRRRTAVGA